MILSIGFRPSQAIAGLHRLGAIVLFTGGHHRKIAIIDSRVLNDGSLNVLSKNESCEIMRCMNSEFLANQVPWILLRSALISRHETPHPGYGTGVVSVA